MFRRRRSRKVTGWHKSTLSQMNGNCVETAPGEDGSVWMRDTKDPEGGVLLFPPGEWAAFTEAVRNGEFDLRPRGGQD